MSLVQLTLTIAERNMIEAVSGSLYSVKADVAVLIKHVRKDLGAKEVRTRIDRFNTSAIKLGFAGLSWRDLMDNTDYMEFLEEQLEAANTVIGKETEDQAASRTKRVAGIEKLVEKLRTLNGEQPFSVDTRTLRDLRDLMTDPAKVDLARHVSMDQMGQIRETVLPPSADQVDIFASVIEKLGDSLAVK